MDNKEKSLTATIQRGGKNKNESPSTWHVLCKQVHFDRAAFVTGPIYVTAATYTL